MVITSFSKESAYIKLARDHDQYMLKVNGHVSMHWDELATSRTGNDGYHKPALYCNEQGISKTQ